MPLREVRSPKVSERRFTAMFTAATARRKLAISALPLAVVAATIAAAGTASATNYADLQANLAENLSTTKMADNLSVRTAVSPDLHTIAATLDNGRFVATPDATTISIESITGAPVASIPATLSTAAGNTISLATSISADGHSLEITPQFGAATGTELSDIATNPGAQFPDPVLNGAAAGAAIGILATAILCIPTIAAFVIGYAVCAVAGSVIDGILGAVVGAVLGTVVPDVIPQVLP